MLQSADMPFTVNTPVWFSLTKTKMVKNEGCTPTGLSPPNSNSVEIFVQCTYSPSFISLCLLVQKLPHWQTNKETPLKTSNTLRYAMTLGKKIKRWGHEQNTMSPTVITQPKYSEPQIATYKISLFLCNQPSLSHRLSTSILELASTCVPANTSSNMRQLPSVDCWQRCSRAQIEAVFCCKSVFKLSTSRSLLCSFTNIHTDRHIQYQT